VTALVLTGLLALHLVLILLPLAAGALIAAALGVRDLLVQVLAGVTGFGVLAMLTFWVYLADPHAGQAFALVALLASLVGGVWAVRRTAATHYRRLLPPTAFLAAYTLLMTGLGYLRGGLHAADLTGRNRYLPNLSTDSQLPQLFARQLQSSTRPLPHFLAAPWQASDRPPLQTGAYLLQQAPLGHGSFLDYQLASMVLQSFWVLGVWAFLRAARLGNRLVALGLAAVAFSGFTIVNTFYVWPKLLPAGYLMLAATALLGRSFERYRRSWVAGGLIGLAIGCAMLGHPGSLFGALALALLAARRPSWRLALPGGAGLLVMYLPWLLFGKYYAPPGNFLTKWQLADVYNYKDQRSVGQAVSDAYRAAGWSGTVRNKWLNLTEPFHDSLRVFSHGWRLLGQQPLTASGTGSQAGYQVELSIYTFYVPALGLFAWGMLALVLRRYDRRRSALRLGRLGLACLVVSWLAWALVLFGPAKTTNQQSSYFLQLLGFCLGVLGWWLLSPRLCAVLVAAQAAFSLWLYGYRPPLAGSGPQVIGQHPQWPLAALSVLALALCGLSLAWLARPEPIGEDGYARLAGLSADRAGDEQGPERPGGQREAVPDGPSTDHAVLAGGPATARGGPAGPRDRGPLAAHRRLDGAHRDR